MRLEISKREKDPPPAVMRAGRIVRLVRFTGFLPEQPASFLGRLSVSEKLDVYAILGTFQEVRGLIGTARLLHQYLKEAPKSAARGQTTLAEFLAEKLGLHREIASLREKVTRAAEKIGLLLPPVPNLNIGGGPR